MKKKKKKMETTYFLDFKTYKEFSRGFMFSNPKSNILLIIITVLLYMNLFLENYKFSLIYGICCIFIIVISFLNKGKLQYHRSLESNGGKVVHLKYTFDEEVITALNLDNSNQNQYQYDQILSIVETENLFILKLKYRLGLIVNKHDLHGGSREEFIQFIFDQCTNLKEKKIILSKNGLYIRVGSFILSLICVICSILFI